MNLAEMSERIEEMSAEAKQIAEDVHETIATLRQMRMETIARRDAAVAKLADAAREIAECDEILAEINRVR